MKIYRSRRNLWLAGVCGGLAEHFGLPSGRLRLVWILGTIFSGGLPGILLYVAFWYLVPKEPEPQDFEPAVLQPWKKSV
jgi:phage shock protein C